MRKLNFAAVAVCVAVTGCASTHVSALRLERSQAAIRLAEQQGALEVPAARTHLQRARDEQESARQLANLGDDRAETVLACADADARLAAALAEEAAMRSETERAEAELAQAKGGAR